MDPAGMGPRLYGAWDRLFLGLGLKAASPGGDRRRRELWVLTGGHSTTIFPFSDLSL